VPAGQQHREVGGGHDDLCRAAALTWQGPGTRLILAVSGLFGCYQVAANASFVQASPPGPGSQAFGIAQNGISLGQGTAIVVGALLSLMPPQIQ
jgi:hypothetical protein